MSDEILKERHGRVLVITINRPESRNAVNLAVSQGLADAVDELDENGDLSVAVITGAGRNFCSGMDLKAFAAGEVVAIPGRGIGFTERPLRLQKRIPFQKASNWPSPVTVSPRSRARLSGRESSTSRPTRRNDRPSSCPPTPPPRRP